MKKHYNSPVAKQMRERKTPSEGRVNGSFKKVIGACWDNFPAVQQAHWEKRLQQSEDILTEAQLHDRAEHDAAMSKLSKPSLSTEPPDFEEIEWQQTLREAFAAGRKTGEEGDPDVPVRCPYSDLDLQIVWERGICAGFEARMLVEEEQKKAEAVLVA